LATEQPYITRRGVGFIHINCIQSELMNVNAGIGYVYNYN